MWTLARFAKSGATGRDTQRDKHPEVRWTLLAEPDGAAPSRKPADSASGVAGRALGGGAVSGARRGPGPLAGTARDRGGTALGSPCHRTRLGRSPRTPVRAHGVV